MCMQLTEKDKKDYFLVQDIIRRVDRIDEIYAASESDLIYKQQPFLISLILGYRVDLKPKNFELATKCIFVIWEYFKSNDAVKRIAITKEQFDRIHEKIFYLLQYFEKETNEGKVELLEFDFGKLKSKALYAGLMGIFEDQNPSNKKDSEAIATLSVGMKCLIECFEELGKARESA